MEDFALILGDSRLRLSKILNEMQDAGVLVLHRKEIEIPDLAALIQW